MERRNAKLTLGPVLFNWAPEAWRDFYFRIADEAPVSTVYLGEAICSKRAPLFEQHYDASERAADRGRQDGGLLDAGRSDVQARPQAGRRRLRRPTT